MVLRLLKSLNTFLLQVKCINPAEKQSALVVTSMSMSKFGTVRNNMKDSSFLVKQTVFSPSSRLFLCRNRISFKAILFTLQKYVTETKIRCLLCMQHKQQMILHYFTNYGEPMSHHLHPGTPYLFQIYVYTTYICSYIYICLFIYATAQGAVL